MKADKALSVAQNWLKITQEKGTSYGKGMIPESKIRAFRDSTYITSILARTGKEELCLETGCGSGTFSISLATKGMDVTAIDISAGVLANIERNTDILASKFHKIKTPKLVMGDIENLPFENNRFKVVFSEGVIEHWIDSDQRSKVIKEMKRVIKPGGFLILFVPNGRHPFYKWWKITRYPGYICEDIVPWHRFNSFELAGELADQCFTQIVHDGISPWSTLAVWPDWFLFRALASLCRRIFPEPLWFRRKMGFNLMAVGKKPEVNIK